MKEVNWGRQAILALSLFILGTFAFWLEYKHKPAQESAEEQKKRVFSIQDTSVKSITLVNNGSQVAVECLDFDAGLCKPQGTSRWRLVSPIKGRADDSNVNSLVTAMGKLDTSDIIDLKEESAEKRQALLKDYGLDSESRKTNSQVEVVTAMGKSILSIGLAHPVGNSVFALRMDNGKEAESVSVFMIPNYFTSQVSHDLSYWRDKKVMPFESHEIVSFELNGQKDHFSVARKEGLWELKNASGQMPGDAEAIDQALNTLTHLSAKSIVQEDHQGADALKLLKGFSPLLSVTLGREEKPASTSPETPDSTAPAKEDRSIELTFYEKKQSGKSAQPNPPTYLVSSASSVLYELDSNSISRFDKEVKDLRQSKLLTPMEQFTIRNIQLSGKDLGADPIVFKDTDGKWSSTSFPSFPTEKIQGLLEQLGKSKIQNFIVSSKIPPGEKEGLQVILENDKGELKKKWVFWRKNGQTLARDLNSKRNEAYQIESSIDPSLPWTKEYFSPPAAEKK